MQIFHKLKLVRLKSIPDCIRPVWPSGVVMRDGSRALSQRTAPVRVQSSASSSSFVRKRMNEMLCEYLPPMLRFESVHERERDREREAVGETKKQMALNLHISTNCKSIAAVPLSVSCLYYLSPLGLQGTGRTFISIQCNNNAFILVQPVAAAAAAAVRFIQMMAIIIKTRILFAIFYSNTPRIITHRQ